MSEIFFNLVYPFETKFIQVDDYRIAYVDEGQSDKIILFLHGLGSYIPAWKFNIQELKNHFRCIAIDLPGFGKSDKKIHSGSMEFYGDIVLKFIQSIGVAETNLVGHSMGGQIAINCALNFPDLIDKLVLIAPAGLERFTKEEIQIIKNITKPENFLTTEIEQIKTNYEMSFYNFPVEAKFLIEDRIKISEDDEFYNYCIATSNSISGMIEQPIFERLKEINQHTLVIFGKNDSLIPNKYLHKTTTEEIAKSGCAEIPHSNLFLLDECGHFAQIEKSEQVNQAIKNFLL
ncbi:MAG: alpha/beta fold hydrolase [Ignavibacterium sp.]|jgi:pimeloyl-ACP methyl ester carboxylesterase|uniref:alpha/beta fold hydrolase n=1 Tax=Ignavibacterium sp. TaxID=2651167 RepID=UPI0032999AFC